METESFKKETIFSKHEKSSEVANISRPTTWRKTVRLARQKNNTLGIAANNIGTVWEFESRNGIYRLANDIIGPHLWI